MVSSQVQQFINNFMSQNVGFARAKVLIQYST